MATVTGYTAARMKQIEDAAIIDGEVVGNNLILEPKGFATDPGGYPKIDAGNVRGPIGPQGVPGEVTTASLNAALLALLPPGAITMWAGAAAPATWALCDGGQSSRTTDAALFAAIGTTYGVGNGTTTFNRPNLQNKFPVGKGTAAWSDALNDTGGSKDAVVVTHGHTSPAHGHSTPSHQHSTPSHGHDVTHSHGADVSPAGAPHTHTGQTNLDGAHNHLVDPYGNYLYSVRHVGAGSAALGVVPGSDAMEWHNDVGDTYETHWHNFTTNEGGGAAHDHGITISMYGAGTAGSGTLVTSPGEGGGSATTTAATVNDSGVTGVDANLPPFITLNFIIKL